MLWTRYWKKTERCKKCGYFVTAFGRAAKIWIKRHERDCLKVFHIAIIAGQVRLKHGLIERLSWKGRFD